MRRQAVDVEAVAGVSFTVGAGEMIGYVGPNGAGKSTTIKMLTGILQPSGGRVRVAGLDPARQRLEVAKRIGVVFGQRSQLWWDLPLRDSFELLRHIYRVPADAYRQRLAYFVELLELGSFLETPVRQLSLGQRMRGDLTAALLHAPPVLFLDEPSIGLDVVAKARIRELLAQINRDQGVTMLLTTHDMADIERLCSRMLIIDHGRVIYDGGLEAIREQYGDERTVVVDLEEAAAAARRAQRDGHPHGWSAPVAPLPPQRDDGRPGDRRRRRHRPPARPDDRGAGHRGHRARHLRARRAGEQARAKQQQTSWTVRSSVRLPRLVLSPTSRWLPRLPQATASR